MADIFISYSKQHPQPTRDLAAYLESEGYSVWWDIDLKAGERFRDVIKREIDAAKAVIVIWTADSIESDWVVAEAEQARQQKKLIPLRTKELGDSEIPKPYDAYHTEVVDNRPAILAAVRRVAGLPALATPNSGASAAVSEETVYEGLALEHWQVIKNSNDAAKLRAFLADYGASKCARLASDQLRKLEAAAFAKLPRRPNEVALRNFLAQGWDGDLASEARTVLQILLTKRDEKDRAKFIDRLLFSRNRLLRGVVAVAFVALVAIMTPVMVELAALVEPMLLPAAPQQTAGSQKKIGEPAPSEVVLNGTSSPSGTPTPLPLGEVPVDAPPLAKSAEQTAIAPPSAMPAGSPCGSQETVSLASHRATPLSVAQECSLKPRDSFKECDDCPEMVVVPAGAFTMGSPKGETGRKDNEGPQHVVTIRKPFAVGKLHVTVDQFAAFVSETGYEASPKCYNYTTDTASWRNPGFPQEGSHPVVCVSWDDAKAYVNWLTKKTGKPYRLLSEAEWEYASRGRTAPGTYPRFWFGDNEKDLCRYVNGFDQKAGWTYAPCNDGYANTSPAGHYAPNVFGLYDMSGNAAQWAADCWHDSYRGSPIDGSPVDGSACARAARGGSWHDVPWQLRAAARNAGGAGPSGLVRSDFGFRVARTLTP